MYGSKVQKAFLGLRKEYFIGDDTKKCSSCGESKIKKNGRSRGRQRYQCKGCGHTFYRYQKHFDVASAYHDYSYGRQTLSQIASRHGISERRVQEKFDAYQPLSGTIRPVTHPVHVFIDATFFGREFGVLVFRSEGKNLYWRFIQSESLADLEMALEGLDQICLGGYLGFTIDGKPGLRQLLDQRYEKPVYMCLFHQQQIVRRYTTTRPKTSCGQALRRFSLSLTRRPGLTVSTAFAVFEALYDPYLRERNDKGQFTHRRLRSAHRSLRKNLPFLCLEPHCPWRTNNTCEGSFSHWKAKIKIHRSLRFDRKIYMINFLLAHDSPSIF